MAFVKFERPQKREATEISICETGEIKINPEWRAFTDYRIRYTGCRI